jgi:murein DD-endopeptidase MepM/ murein hydrolase activator NlpD
VFSKDRTKKTATIVSGKTDFAKQILHAPRRAQKQAWPYKLHAAGLMTVAALWMGYFFIPDSGSEAAHSFEYNEKVDAFVNLAKQDHYITGPMPLAPISVTQAKIAKARLTSPILATNMATTQYFGPPEKFEVLPNGKVTEVKVKSGDTLGTIFNRVGVGATTLQAVLEQDLAGAELQKLYPGQTLTFVTDQQGLKQIRYPHSASETFVINKNDNGISVDLIERPREVRKNYATATINGSLYMSAKEANIDNKIIMQLAEIFAYDIDFYLDIKRGDKFRVLYEEYYVDGEKVGNGPILAAEFTNQGKTYQVVRYTNKDGSSQYYTSDGMTLRKAFLRSPVEYARISSHFNLSRKHPILHQIRAHKGVDYAAPRGTPIVAAGDGKVVQFGRRGAYGNMIEIQHNGQYRTLYAHMNGFAKNISMGSKVEQGQVIGYVGSTGLASGPHLHYEFKVNGVQKDPVKIDLPMAEPLPKQEKDNFMLHASNMFNELEEYNQILLAYQSSKTQSQG